MISYMKKLIFLLCALGAVLTAQGQLTLPDARINPEALKYRGEAVRMRQAPGPARVISAAKTSEDLSLDTVYLNDGYQYQLDHPNEFPGCGAYYEDGGYTYAVDDDGNLILKGYRAGTLSAFRNFWEIAKKPGDGYFTEHGRDITISRASQCPKARLIQTYIGFAKGIFKDMPDTFVVSMQTFNEAHPNGDTVLTTDGRGLVAFGYYNADDIDGGFHPGFDGSLDLSKGSSFYENPTYRTTDMDTSLDNLNGRYLLAIETVHGPGGDFRKSDPDNEHDTLSFFFRAPADKCDAFGDVSWYVKCFADTGGENVLFLGWRKHNKLFAYTDPDTKKTLEQDAFYIIPVIEFECPTSRGDENFSEMSNLRLYDAYPNPASVTSTLTYELKANANRVAVSVLDIEGRTVYESRTFSAPIGVNTFQLHVADLPCGVYTYLLQTDQGSLGGRILVDRP